ncbi:MAG: hypothetical protein AVDCRST_MAG59-1566 [uncultured Thermomicrobiales bacterium]|uniref:Uncharacterized protein n=1 Tax=uncultured Thermomicrobiales bacterium TaxID=1645740 RepID=A0A6J4UHE0_9BACT|nr:MAG: hypothetical protein AVDCRST_MAG59-1566 [uncultured Thermomicrobiales bacterium]
MVETAPSWLTPSPRLLTRWEKAAHYLGFVQLVACLIIHRKVRHACSRSG